MTSTFPFNECIYFLGERNYVQAPNQMQFVYFTVMAERDIMDCSQIKVRRYKQLKEVSSQIALLDLNEQIEEEDLRATFELEINHKVYFYKLISVSGDLPRKPDKQYCQTDVKIDRNQLFATAKLEASISFWNMLSEVVQLTKILHIDCYNEKEKFRFVVGGFENIQYFEPTGNSHLNIEISIVRSWKLNDVLYNQTKVKILQNGIMHDFIVPFSGKPVGI